jgi:2-iminobutanoate/2-iminopropanoate deaminase
MKEKTEKRGMRLGNTAIALVSAAVLATAHAEPTPPPQLLASPASSAQAVRLFSTAVGVGDTLYTAGQLGIDQRTGQLVSGGIRPEAKQALNNIKGILENNGYALNNVVKCTVFLTDISEVSAFNDIYKTFFSEPFPARSAVGVSSLQRNARVEVECIAAKSAFKQADIAPAPTSQAPQ